MIVEQARAVRWQAAHGLGAEQSNRCPIGQRLHPLETVEITDGVAEAVAGEEAAAAPVGRQPAHSQAAFPGQVEAQGRLQHFQRIDRRVGDKGVVVGELLPRVVQFEPRRKAAAPVAGIENRPLDDHAVIPARTRPGIAVDRLEPAAVDQPKAEALRRRKRLLQAPRRLGRESQRRGRQQGQTKEN